MKLTIVVIDEEQNGKFGKKKRLSRGQARLNTFRVRFVPGTMTLDEVTKPPEEGALEVLDEETAEYWRGEIEKRSEHELV